MFKKFKSTYTFLRAGISLFIMLFLSINLSSQVIYVHDELNALYKYDLSNCNAELLVQMEQISPITDIAFHPDGNLYGITDLGQFVFIDTITGNLGLIHNFPFNFDTFSPFYTSLTIDANGIVYTAGDSEDLLSYNFSTDTEANLGDMGVVAAGDLTFYQGNLYVATLDDKILQVDINDASNTTQVINASSLQNLFGLVSFWNGCNDIQTYLINTTSNLATSTLHSVNFDVNTFSNSVCSSNTGFLGAAHPKEYLASILPLFLTDININDTTCDEANGNFSFNITGGIGPFTYSLDNILFQDSSSFQNLEPGNYNVYIEDQLGCVIIEEFQIQESDGINIESIETNASICESNNGGIEIITENENVLYSINGSEFSEENTFTSLEAGDYTILIQDGAGCEETVDVTIEEDTENCGGEIEIPNIFTPNFDGNNDYFYFVGDPGDYELQTFLIYSRWGQKIYDNNNPEIGWDGTFKGKPVDSGVYAYVIILTRANGTTKSFSGDVTLIR